MSLGNCIPGLVAEGKLTKKQGERAQAAYDRHYKRISAEMGPIAAAAEASEVALRQLEFEARQAKRQAFLAVESQRRIGADMKSYKGKSRAAAALALFDHDGKAPYLNVEAVRRTIVGRAHAKMAGILERHSRNLFGEVRDKSGLIDVVRELRGEKTGNASAREMAEAFRAATEELRLRFNAAGGAIGKLVDWAPQSHDSLKVRAAGFDAWRAKIAPLLDRGRMIDDATGRPFDDETLNEVLREVFENIRTEGWANRAPGAAGGRKTANRRAEHRFLHFKDAAAWFDYDAEFGTGNVFDAMMGHVEGMARDIAHMEVLGPNPAATVRWLQDGLMKEAELDPDPKGALLDKARTGGLSIEKMYAVTSGALNAPVSTKWARRFGTVRSINVAQMLGTAAISAFTDIGFQGKTRGFNGLPLTGALTGYLKLLSPGSQADRRLAVRLGLIAEEASKLGSVQQRYLGESIGHEWSRRLADGVLRASGLSAWTQAGRWAFGMEFLGHLADEAGKGLDQLSKPLRDALERYGIDAAGWDAIRASTPYEHKGARFLRPEDVVDAKLADRLHAMVLTETDYAVPVASVRARAMMTFGRPGTLAGELSRNMFLFKSFGVSMMLSHGARAMSLRPVNRAIYAVGGTIILTMLGAMAVQMKEIVKGRDPLPMEDAPEIKDGKFEGGFWARALLQGGGFGIFGDFLAAGTSERTGSLQEAILGPVVGTAADAFRYVSGNMEEADVARRYTPGGTLWYGRLAYERLLIDELRAWTDENYYDSWARMEKRAEEQGQGLWWRPGEGAPDRAPELATAFEAPPE
ncbi:MAG: hypothetical protein M3Q08_03585 [Pseudomonadota bacterium]|nr:hypothetical protein [Pseudomonadota bacterium]